jgi:hypothetical protein
VATQERLIISLYAPKAQSGKSTVAGILKKRYGFQERHFATALKRMVFALMDAAGIDIGEQERLTRWAKTEPIPSLGGASFRTLCQTVGSEWGRDQIHPDLWVNIFLQEPDLPALVVVDDLRFPNEFDAIRREGGQVWKITRPNGFETTDHASEGLLETYEFDEELVNDGDMAELEAKVIKALIGP